jgi:hypothetical protein
VSVEVMPGSVVVHGGARVGVPGGDLDIGQVDAGVEHRGNGSVPETAEPVAESSIHPRTGGPSRPVRYVDRGARLGHLALSAPPLTIAAWFAYDAVTSTSEWAVLGSLVTVAIAVPVVPAVILAVVASRIADPLLARVLAVIAAFLVASIPLLGV